MEVTDNGESGPFTDTWRSVIPVPTNEALEWYALNAEEAGKIMLPGTKGHMLATEAVPTLLRAVRNLQSSLARVCSHPNSDTRDRCLWCGFQFDGRPDADRI